MRRLTAAAALTALVLAAPALSAQPNIVGQDAPDFKLGDTINDSAIKTIEDARGEVILIKYWGTN
jgi:hypothetical protein